MSKIAVALFSSRAQAEPVQQCLARAGITAEIQEELWLQKLWFVSRQAAGVLLEVAADQFERAEQLLHSWDTPKGVLCHAIRCPECKSLLVDYPQFARHSVVTNVAAGLLAEMGLVERQYYCEHCHHTWPKARTSPARERPHMAPYYFIEGVPKAPAKLPTQPPSRLAA